MRAWSSEATDATVAMAERVALRRAYRLLGDLLVDGIDAARLDEIRELPLRTPLDDVPDLDALAAEHYALLGHQLPPYAGVFLGREGLVGEGSSSERLREAHALLGREGPEGPSPDHLGQALRLMSALVDAELDARSHHDHADVAALRRWQVRVLDEALLPWMPPLVAALAGQPPSLWIELVELAVGVLARHRAGDGSLPSVVDPRDGDGEAEPEPAALLDDPRTGLRTVAELLTTPRRCGALLTRRDLAAVGRACELPAGFGGREDMLERMLRAAAEYGAMPRLTAEIGRVLATRDDAMATLAAEPGLAAVVAGWRRRIAATQVLLERLSAAAAELSDPAQRTASHPC